MGPGLAHRREEGHHALLQHVVEVVRADQGPEVVAGQVALGVVAHADRRQRARAVGVEAQQLVRRVVRPRLGRGRAAVGYLVERG